MLQLWTLIAGSLGVYPSAATGSLRGGSDNWVPTWWETQGTGPPPWGKNNPDGSDPSCVKGQIPPMSTCVATGREPVDSCGQDVNLDDINSKCVNDATPAWPTGKWPVLLHGSYWESSGCDTSNIRKDFTVDQVNKQMKNWLCVFNALYTGEIDEAIFEFPGVKNPQGQPVEAAMSWGHGAFEGMCGNSALMCNPAGQAGLDAGTKCIINLQNGPRTWSGEFRANAYINSHNYGGICVQPVGFMPAGSNGDFGKAVPDFFVEEGGVNKINTKYVKAEYRDKADEAQKNCF